MTVRILIGDCRDVLRTLPDESVHCVVTSPPYFGLRDYGVAGQIGLETDFADYIAGMLDVFREVHRVLRADGTLWVNLGDSYATGTGKGRKPTQTGKHGYWENPNIAHRVNGADFGLKPKDLIGIPWRVAFALQEDGWWLRQDIIWSKPNPMPESVTDRCTKAHEYLFLLAKSERYYYDADAIKEPAEAGSRDPSPRKAQQSDGKIVDQRTASGFARGVEWGDTRNKRSVWNIAAQPFSEAHFATFPPDLIEPCIKAGTSEKGCCPCCGAGWVRVFERGASSWAARKEAGHPTSGYHASDGAIASRNTPAPREGKKNEGGLGWVAPKDFLGWAPSCSCLPPDEHHPVPCTVLDPFGGAGTTGLVADRLGRNAILIELNPAYAEIARKRISGDCPMFTEVNAA